MGLLWVMEGMVRKRTVVPYLGILPQTRKPRAMQHIVERDACGRAPARMIPPPCRRASGSQPRPLVESIQATYAPLLKGRLTPDERAAALDDLFNIVSENGGDRTIAWIGARIFDRYVKTWEPRPNGAALSAAEHAEHAECICRAAVACAMIAMKYEDDTKTFTAGAFAAHRNARGISMKALVAEERAVLEAIDYRVGGPSPVEYTDALYRDHIAPLLKGSNHDYHDSSEQAARDLQTRIQQFCLLTAFFVIDDRVDARCIAAAVVLCEYQAWIVAQGGFLGYGLVCKVAGSVERIAPTVAMLVALWDRWSLLHAQFASCRTSHVTMQPISNAPLTGRTDRTDRTDITGWPVECPLVQQCYMPIHPKMATPTCRVTDRPFVKRRKL